MGVLMSCPTGLFFDTVLNICNWPEYVDCQEHEETTTTTTTTTTTKDFDAVCHESQDGYAVFVPHPYDCSLYYECVGLTPVLMSCPSGLFFDSRIDTCNWPEYVDCEVATTTTTTITTPSTTTSTSTTASNTTTTPSPTTSTATTPSPSTTTSTSTTPSNTTTTPSP